MNWSTISLRKLIHHKPHQPKREKVKPFVRDEKGKIIPDVKTTMPPPDSEWSQFYGNPKNEELTTT